MSDDITLCQRSMEIDVESCALKLPHNSASELDRQRFAGAEYIDHNSCRNICVRISQGMEFRVLTQRPCSQRFRAKRIVREREKRGNYNHGNGNTHMHSDLARLWCAVSCALPRWRYLSLDLRCYFCRCRRHSRRICVQGKIFQFNRHALHITPFLPAPWRCSSSITHIVQIPICIGYYVLSFVVCTRGPSVWIIY